MALKLDYVVRETVTNLQRNITLTVAAIVTIAVSLALFGSSLLLSNALGNATERWRGGIEFIVFMNPEVTESQRNAIRDSLDANPDIDRIEYVDKDATYAEYKRLFRDQPQLYNAVEPEILPTSFRVVPRIKDAAVVGAMGEQYEDKAGVREVIYPEKIVRALERISGKISSRLLFAAGTLLIAALLLILNTIRVAMFARRREIEVMKLVGATNWFIRVPFIVEGVVQALLGCALSIGMLFLSRSLIEGLDEEDFPLLSNFVVEDGQLVGACLIVLAVGILVGAVGSALAASRFLDV